MKSFLYPDNLPFSKVLIPNLLDVYNRVRINKASMIIIDGSIGEGKTTLGIHLADKINNLYGLPPIDFNKQLAIGGVDFLKKLRLCYEYGLPVLIYDEAGDFNRRGSLTQFNAMLNRTFETFRAFKIIIILILPSFNSLDEDLFRKGIPRLLLHVDNRNENNGDFHGYSLFRMFYLKEKMKKLIVKGYAYQLEEPNFHGHFLDLPPEREKELDKISIKGKIDILTKSEIKIEGLVNYVEIASKLVRSVLWVRIAINKLKIKPTRIIKRTKYFKDDCINVLADYIDTKATTQRKDTGEGR
jgi:hypothetical protein